MSKKPTKKQSAWNNLVWTITAKRLPGTRGKYEIAKQKRLTADKLRKSL